MEFRIEFEREEDGRWIAEFPELHGVICYGANEGRGRGPGTGAGPASDPEQIKQNMTAPKSIRFASA